MAAQPKPVTIRSKAALELLVDNIANLEHPHGWIKHPYFDERFAQNPAGVRELKRKFCEAVILLLEKNGAKIVARRG
ncbi:hypothetical protein E2F47_23600 [Mycobacterium eburneum]|nr:hypothetical protein [Mycobacterium eburneum]TDH48504.1 hypothetical protein E2F47_23600 [Mycobacterium eburneum]